MKTESLSHILNELKTTRAAILREIEKLPDTQLNAKPKREMWSMIQILHHLHLVEQSVTSNITYSLQNCEPQDVPRKMIPVTLDHIHIPDQFMPTETIMKRDQMIELLKASRARLLKVLGEIEDERELWRKSSSHPMLGELGLGQWLQFYERYERQYLYEIQEAKRALHR
ncbi:DinB family protein [Ectobacillus polymachus]|uniref:DinB family protein n=1 Tax=Ectobacillus polymachus TaxID=1508806 RepID=UPI003A8BD3A1